MYLYVYILPCAYCKAYHSMEAILENLHRCNSLLRSRRHLYMPGYSASVDLQLCLWHSDYKSEVFDLELLYSRA